MSPEFRPYRTLLFLVALAALQSVHTGPVCAQNQRGLGPGGSRLTKPDPPSSGTGFGPGTGFGASTASGARSSGGSDTSGTRCVSIQCADGTVVGCNETCPRPSSAPSSGGPRSTSPSYREPTPSSGVGDAWRAEEERRRREEARKAEEERARRAEFEKGREEVYRTLKGAAGGELGLKGAGQNGSLQLKGGDASARAASRPAKAECGPSNEASTVNLCGFDPGKPIVVDIDTAKGRRRAQISLRTLEHDSYDAGFKAILERDYEAAVQHFRSAQKQLGDDLFVRNGLALAQDLLRVQRQKAQLDAARRAFHEGVQLGFARDYAGAVAQLNRAVSLDPTNARYRDELSFMQGVGAGAALERDKNADATRRALARKAFEVAEKAVVPMALGDWPSAVATLRAALVVYPDDPTVQDVLDIAVAAQKKQAARSR